VTRTNCQLSSLSSWEEPEPSRQTTYFFFGLAGIFRNPGFVAAHAGCRPQAPRFIQLQMNSLRHTRHRDQMRLRERSAEATSKHQGRCVRKPQLGAPVSFVIPAFPQNDGTV
jgi:hypothetical protein